MNVLEYVQGKSTVTDRELFGQIGAWLVSKEVHDTLGTAITTNEGDLWWVAIQPGGAVAGFATARLLANRSLHVRFVHAPDDPAVAHQLVERAIAIAQSLECVSIWTNDRETATVWKKLRFVPTPRARGSFVRWDRALKAQEEKKPKARKDQP